jgi:hypothetical protein
VHRSVGTEHTAQNSDLRKGGGGGGALAPAYFGDEVQEFCELVHFLCPAPRHENIMGKVVNVVHLPVVGVRVNLHMTPSVLDVRVPVRLSTNSTLWLTAQVIYEVDGVVRVNLRYATQQSLLTVVPGSIHASTTAVKVSGVLSRTGTRNVLFESHLELN